MVSRDRSDLSAPIPWHERTNARLVLGGALLLLEYLLLSFAFDAKSVVERQGIWRVIGLVGNVGPLVIVAVAAVLLVPSLHAAANELRGRAKALHRPILALHLVFAALFAYVTTIAFVGNAAPRGPAILWMLLWASLGATTAVSLFVGLIGDWLWLARGLRRTLWIGGLLGSAAWFGGMLSAELWTTLGRLTFIGVTHLLDIFNLQLHSDPTSVVIELEGFAVSVAPVCSGSEGIGLYLVLMSLFLYGMRQTLRFPRALLLLPLGVCVVWLGNVARIAALMVVGARIDEGVALGSFHSKAGWVFFSAITLLMAFIARKATALQREVPGETEPKLHNPAQPLLLPVLLWIGIGLVTSTFYEQHDPLYGVRVVVVSAAISYFRRDLRQYIQRPTWPAWAVGLSVGIGWLIVPIGSAGQAVAAPGFGWPPWAFGVWLVSRCLGAVVVVPICEELAFRGYLARWISRRPAFWELPLSKLNWLGIVGSSLAFGALHSRWVVGTVTGIAFALLVRRSGRLADGIVAHAVANATIAIWVISTGDWRHW